MWLKQSIAQTLLQWFRGFNNFPFPLSLGIYKCTFSHKKLGIPKENLATKSLPHLVSLSIDNNLNLNQVIHSLTHIHTHLHFLHLQICEKHFVYFIFNTICMICLIVFNAIPCFICVPCFSLTRSWWSYGTCWVVWRLNTRPSWSSCTSCRSSRGLRFYSVWWKCKTVLHINEGFIRWNIWGNWICRRKQLAVDTGTINRINGATSQACLIPLIQIPSVFVVYFHLFLQEYKHLKPREPIRGDQEPT